MLGLYSLVSLTEQSSNEEESWWPRIPRTLARCGAMVPGTMRSGHQRKLSGKTSRFCWWEVKAWAELLKLRGYGKASQCLLEAPTSHSESCQIKERIKHNSVICV